MRKISVYLTEDDKRLLARLAARGGSSQAEVLRRAVRAYEAIADADRNFAVAGSADGPGGSVADTPEEELLAGFGR
jgi:predicted transcriptional regulator